jgi:hypothetical protein
MLISNKIFFIHETALTEPNHNFDKIIFSDYDKLLETCEKYLKISQEERDKIAENQYQWWKTKHSMEKYLPLDKIKEFIQ